RRQADAFEQVADEVPEMRLEFLASLGVSFADIDRHTPAHLLRLRGVAGFFAALAEHRENTAEYIDVEIRHAHVRVAPLSDELNGLATAQAGNPDRRVRLLQRARPGIDVTEVVMLRVPDKRPRRRPRLHDEVQRLAEFLAGMRRVDSVAEILRPAADD